VRATDDAARLWPTSETVFGPTRSLGGNPSNGSLTISGIEQTGTPQSATSGTTTITVSGTDGEHLFCHTVHGAPTCVLLDTGTIGITVDGFTVQVTYGVDPDFTNTDIVNSFVAGFTGGGSPVTAVGNGTSFTLTSIATGAESNYPLSITNAADFSVTDPNSTLTGGQDSHSGNDTGTITVSINGSPLSPVSWGRAAIRPRLPRRLRRSFRLRSPHGR